MFKIKPKEVKEFIEPLLKEGWRLERGKHYKLFTPSGGMITISLTGSTNLELQLLKNRVRRVKENRAYERKR
jgi:predicted RNA binding protein YcfA (HicA-like mRNA interferase family)